jgi:hypothetical protein
MVSPLRRRPTSSKTPPPLLRTVCPTSTADPCGAPGAAPLLHQPVIPGSRGGRSAPTGPSPNLSLQALPRRCHVTSGFSEHDHLDFNGERNPATAELEELRRAQLRGGVSADMVPAGVLPATAMLQAVRDAQPRRRTPLEEALGGGGLVYHPIERDDES